MKEIVHCSQYIATRSTTASEINIGKQYPFSHCKLNVELALLPQLHALWIWGPQELQMRQWTRMDVARGTFELQTTEKCVRGSHFLLIILRYVSFSVKFQNFIHLGRLPMRTNALFCTPYLPQLILKPTCVADLPYRSPNRMPQRRRVSLPGSYLLWKSLNGNL